MADQVSKIVNHACANDSAIWMQKDAVYLKGSPDSAKPNPFVPAQAATPQTPVSFAAPIASQQKKP